MPRCVILALRASADEASGSTTTRKVARADPTTGAEALGLLFVRSAQRLSLVTLPSITRPASAPSDDSDGRQPLTQTLHSRLRRNQRDKPRPSAGACLIAAAARSAERVQRQRIVMQQLALLLG